MAKCIYKNLPDLSEARKASPKEETIYDSIFIPEELKSYALGKRYFIRTYGCQANVRDSEIMSGILSMCGFKATSDVKKADFILINTCAVRENAEDKVYGEIGSLKELKKNNKNLIIAICGCMVQQEHIIHFITEHYTHVNLIFGTHNINELPNLINEIVHKNIRLVDVLSLTGKIYENLPSIRDNKHKAFVNIMYGCNKFCTYCIVPYTRGRERSRKMEDILAECDELIKQGYQEITLLGQNVNSYGKDFHNNINFATLLENVAKLGIPRLRFTTSHPWDFSLEMIDVIAKYDNIMKQIHLPVQSGNDEILRLMGRRYNREQYLKLVSDIRQRIPNIYLSTDIIVGFPNETYEQFLDTVSLVKEVQYDGAFTFIYSPRKGTPAAKIEDNVSASDKSKRFNILTDELEKIIEKKSQKMVGKIYSVLVDDISKKDDSMLSGYTEGNKLIHFKGNNKLIGQIVNVKIIESHTYSLIGEIVND